MSMLIEGLATALPAEMVRQDLAATMSAPRCCQSDEQARTMAALYRRSGVRQRGSVLLWAGKDGLPQQSFFASAEGERDTGPTTAQRMARYAADAGPLALAAAEAALAEAPSGRIDHLVTVSCTGFVAPGVDVSLVRDLGLPADITRTHIGFMGCHGAFNALRTARGLVAATPQRALVVAVELCSLHFAYGWNPQQIVANALFADGAAAAVCSADEASAHNGARSHWRVLAHGSHLFADSLEAMTWTIGDSGFAMSLSPRVPDLIGQHLRPWLQSWLAAHGLGLADIATFAVHPGGPRILSSVADALSLPPAALAVSQEVLADCGNMSSPTILFILDRLRRAGARGPAVALGFGPGLAVEAMLLR